MKFEHQLADKILFRLMRSTFCSWSPIFAVIKMAIFGFGNLTSNSFQKCHYIPINMTWIERLCISGAPEGKDLKDHSISMCAKFAEKLTYLSVSGGKKCLFFWNICVQTIWLIPKDDWYRKLAKISKKFIVWNLQLPGKLIDPFLSDMWFTIVMCLFGEKIEFT